MKLLFPKEKDAKINLAKVPLKEKILWHTYWKGPLSEKHLACIETLYQTNVIDTESEIWIWVFEEEHHNRIFQLFQNWPRVHVKVFHHEKETEGGPLERVPQNISRHSTQLAHQSDIVRMCLLYKYGGIWFDLDMIFLRSLHPLIAEQGHRICAQRWSTTTQINNAFFMSLRPRNPKFLEVIHQCKSKQRQGGQSANLSFDKKLDILVLPCVWFDPLWISNPCNLTFHKVFDDISDANFLQVQKYFENVFVLHWHNQWTRTYSNQSLFQKLLDSVLMRCSFEKQ